jgi:hypothetical protein
LNLIADIDRGRGAVGAMVGGVAAFAVDVGPDVADEVDRGGRVRCDGQDQVDAVLLQRRPMGYEIGAGAPTIGD